MRKQRPTTWLVIITGLCVQNAAAYRPSVIYGDDNRQDYFQVMDPAWKQRADATVALVRAVNLDPVGFLTNVKTTPYGSSMGLCPSEPFFEQETAAFCSGFLVAPDTVVTAGHCIRNQSSCDGTKFVFGFRLNAPSTQPRSVQTDQVFSCKQLVHSVAIPTGEDFAVVKLDRPVIHVMPLSFRTQGTPAVGDGLVVIGHPAGLPLKVAGDANVRSIPGQYMVANLDTYGGNSGSAVFNSITGEIEGVLVRGEMDYIYKDGCRVSNRCESAACRGEDVTLFERVLPYVF